MLDYLVTMGRSRIVTSPGAASLTRLTAFPSIATVAISPFVPCKVTSKSGTPFTSYCVFVIWFAECRDEGHGHELTIFRVPARLTGSMSTPLTN